MGMKKTKFKHDTKIGTKVYRINLNLPSETPRYYNGDTYKEGLFVEGLKIVYQTRHKIALNTEWITTLDRKKEDSKSETYKHYLDDVSVSILTKETYFPNGVFCECYTIDNPEQAIKNMKRKIIAKINKEYGFLKNMDIESKIFNMEINK
jgi:hypothetical protein